MPVDDRIDALSVKAEIGTFRSAIQGERSDALVAIRELATIAKSALEAQRIAEAKCDWLAHELEDAEFFPLDSEFRKAEAWLAAAHKAVEGGEGE